jgi:hypothetical protein
MVRIKITIETAVTGWLIRTQPDFPEDRSELYVYSHSDSMDDTAEVNTFASVLWCLNDLIGPTTSRHSKARVYVEVKPGDKHDDYKETKNYFDRSVRMENAVKLCVTLVTPL